MKKILFFLIFLLASTQFLFADYNRVNISCRGELTYRDSTGGVDKEVFYDDLQIYIDRNKITGIKILASSHAIFRNDYWTEGMSFDVADNVINFRQNGRTLEDGEKVEGFKGNLSLVSGMYSGRQLRTDIGTFKLFLSAEIVARCSGINNVLAKLSPNQNDGTGKGSGGSGTAFLINKNGYLLTNHHVVEGCSSSKIIYKGNEYVTKQIASDKTLDLALLKADIKNRSYLNFSESGAKKMQKIFVAGYPLGNGLSDDLKISSGIVSSIKGFKDNSNEIQIDAPINPGNSGGPIINEKGELVAIAVSGLSKAKTEGINFGIKASAAERFLKSNNLSASSSFFSSSKSNDDLLNILENSTVYTYCK